MARFPLRALCALPLLLAPAAHASPFGKAPLEDAALGGMRGGFALPGGLDVAITVQSNTSVNGRPVLTTVFTADRGPAAVSVFAGGAQVDLTSGGSAQTASGTLRVEQGSAGTQVILSSAEMDLRHLAGQTYGSITANRANNVSIDTNTVITLEIRNASAMNLGSTMFRVEAAVVDSAARLVR
ncbi:MAG TPA: hypothetical protein VGB70_14690 [Allosphingosinicella sp.]|jgi:hypothetical protein